MSFLQQVHPLPTLIVSSAELLNPDHRPGLQEEDGDDMDA